MRFIIVSVDSCLPLTNFLARNRKQLKSTTFFLVLSLFSFPLLYPLPPYLCYSLSTFSKNKSNLTSVFCSTRSQFPFELSPALFNSFQQPFVLPTTIPFPLFIPHKSLCYCASYNLDITNSQTPDLVFQVKVFYCIFLCVADSPTQMGTHCAIKML